MPRPLHFDTPENRDLILERIVDGQTLEEIAAELGCTTRAIYKMRERDRELRVQYWEARAFRVEQQISDCIKELRTAGDKTEVMRVKELLNHARWEAEKLIPTYRQINRHELQAKTEEVQRIEIAWAKDAPDVTIDRSATFIEIGPEKV